MDFIVGTTNKAKVEAVKKVLAIHYPNSKLKTASVESGSLTNPLVMKKHYRVLRIEQ